MPNETEEFEKWFENYFCDSQGEESPFSYQDVRAAFKKGFIMGLKRCLDRLKAGSD